MIISPNWITAINAMAGTEQVLLSPSPSPSLTILI